MMTHLPGTEGARPQCSACNNERHHCVWFSSLSRSMLLGAGARPFIRRLAINPRAAALSSAAGCSKVSPLTCDGTANGARRAPLDHRLRAHCSLVQFGCLRKRISRACSPDANSGSSASCGAHSKAQLDVRQQRLKAQSINSAHGTARHAQSRSWIELFICK